MIKLQGGLFMIKYLKLKKIICIMLVIIHVNFFQGCTSYNKNASNNSGTLHKVDGVNTNQDNIRTLNYDEIKNEIIRFHVIANSDSLEDQNLKLKVKNKIIEYLYAYLKSSKSIEESRKILTDKMNEVRVISENVIKDNNYNYDIKLELSKENFPDKTYGNILLPQGEYEAFRIIIGNGQGKNWWCVMFPPLCFVDESKAEVEYDKVDKEIGSIKKEDDINMGELNLDIDKSSEKNYNNEIKLEFKIIEILKTLFN